MEQLPRIKQKTIDLLSYYADALGITNYSWWSNILNVASYYTRSEFERYWNYITIILHLRP
ncbi:hypothetical protein RintRC_6874 [Richelia intracellularis]|nr:hypothetical protein RintRC_6874 [Richelia intracellularis]